MSAAATLITLAQVWGAIGGIVAVAFLTIGVGRIDADSRGAYVFRPLIAPGVVLLWPLVLWRWWVLETGRDRWPLRHRPPRQGHARVWVVLAVLIPAVFIAGLSVRQDWPSGVAPERLGDTEARE